MAAVPVTFNGVFYPSGKSADDKPVKGTFVGMAWLSGVGVGGGPMPGGPDTPPVEPPIDPPPPEHPLDQLLTMVAKAPPPEGGWGWFPEYGWMYAPAGGQAGPKRR